MKKLIVFDWNGTLIADTQICMDADNHMLKAFGGRAIDLKTCRDTFNIPVIDFYVRHGCDRTVVQENSESLSKGFFEFYELRAAKCRTRKGVRELLNWLSTNSVKSIILSNHIATEINQQLTRLQIKNQFAEILANSLENVSFKARNKKEKLADYLERNDYQPEDAFIIGDSPEEVEIGKALEVSSVAITEGHYSEARLKAAQPDFLIHSLRQFQEIIRLS